MAVGCDNMTGYHQKSFFRIPNPYKFKDNKDQFARRKQGQTNGFVALNEDLQQKNSNSERTGFCVKITSRNPCLKRT